MGPGRETAAGLRRYCEEPNLTAWWVGPAHSRLARGSEPHFPGACTGEPVRPAAMGALRLCPNAHSFFPGAKTPCQCWTWRLEEEPRRN